MISQIGKTDIHPGVDRSAALYQSCHDTDIVEDSDTSGSDNEHDDYTYSAANSDSESTEVFEIKRAKLDRDQPSCGKYTYSSASTSKQKSDVVNTDNPVSNGAYKGFKKTYRLCRICRKKKSKPSLHIAKQHADIDQVCRAFKLSGKKRTAACSAFKKEGILQSNREAAETVARAYKSERLTRKS